MAYGNNRAGEQPRSSFRQVGGTIIKFRHPYFAGQIENGVTAIDEVDVSRSVKLEGRFFEANQNQDSAKQVILIDGSTVTITNKMLNGTITVPAVPTTGELATGDFIAGCQLIQSIGDSVGGVLTKTDFVNGKAQTKVFYGVTVQRCPTDVSEGNDVGVYNVQLLYSGWIQAESKSTDVNKKAIWAVGSQQGIAGFYSPYTIQNIEGSSGTGTSPLEATALAPTVGQGISDTVADSADNTAEVADAIKANSTWKNIISGGTAIQAKATPASGS